MSMPASYPSPSPQAQQNRKTLTFPQTKEEWKIYGVYKVHCGGAVFIHPMRPWWWALEFFTIVGVLVLAFEFQKFPLWQSAVGLTLGICNVIASFCATWNDPGVWPKPTYEQAVANFERIRDNPLGARRGHVLVDGKTVEATYCFRCQVYRPMMTGHCAVCDCCIEGWDHHCPVYGGCVGRKNKTSFFVMVLTTPLFWIFFLVISIIYSMSRSASASETGYVWYMDISLMCSLIAFAGAILLPQIFTCFRCCDKAHRDDDYHSHRHSGASTASVVWQVPGSVGVYPRQPLLTPLPALEKPQTNDADIANGNHLTFSTKLKQETSIGPTSGHFIV